jgi:single-strand DNA-binding protein
MIRAGRKRIKPMTIIAACVFTLKKSPTYRLAKDGTMSVWSAFGITGDQAYRIAC